LKLFLETCFADVVFFGSAGISLQLRLLTPPEIFLAMDLDETVDETQVERPLRGFRRRWTSDVAALDEPSPGHISEGVGEDLNLESQPHLFSGSNVDSLEFDQHALDWDFIGHTCDSEEAGLDGTLKRALEIDEDLTEPSTCPQVLDPLGTEPSWKAAALTAEVKRARSDLVKLPWEVEGSVFKSRDLWQGTIVSSLDKMFTPSAIGAVDVLGSQVVHERPDKARPSTEVPVLPIQLKRARREPLEEDIRRKALSKFRSIILQDPLATQLGTSLHSNFVSGFGHDGIEQSFRDCFRMKAASTLQKRAASLDKLSKCLRLEGCLYPLRLSEAQLYSALCRMRAAGSGATSAQHVIEALHFLDATAKLLCADLSEVVSARCRGVARDMYLMKDPLRQKHPLAVEQVVWLEKLMESSGPVFQCIIGQLLFCIHACCRWKDSQRLKSITTESGHGESLLFADALSSKTALTAEAKTRFLPYAAIGSGVSANDWASFWLAARSEQELECVEFVLPSYSEKQACWLDVPMSASEATIWLREFLEGAATRICPTLLGSHSCKTTLLTWAGRSVKLVFTPPERRLLGHHLDANMKSVLCYSRESFTSLYAKVLGMFRMIRSGEFNPDQPAIDRVVQMADGPDESQVEVNAELPDPETVSDSESSMASVDDVIGDDVVGAETDDRLVSLFPAFPGVPETALMVHNISGLVHIVNEDDILSCGRPTSSHFGQYSKIPDREHLAACSQCLRAFQNRKA
jgi:hypothetical protein